MKKITLQDDQKVYFTSDLHFFHKAILDFCPNRIKKYGSTVPEMNENIIADWNETVNPTDIVFVLGDVSFGSITDTAEVLSRLNGELHLVSGNHDQKYLDKKLFTVWFKSTQPYLTVNIQQQKIAMCHFPFAEWDSCHWGSWSLFGHLHGNESDLVKQLKKYKCMDVGVDATGQTLVDFEYIKKYMETKVNLKHGDGAQQGI